MTRMSLSRVISDFSPRRFSCSSGTHTTRKPTNCASEKYQMLLGNCGSCIFHARSEPRRAALRHSRAGRRNCPDRRCRRSSPAAPWCARPAVPACGTRRAGSRPRARRRCGPTAVAPSPAGCRGRRARRRRSTACRGRRGGARLMLQEVALIALHVARRTRCMIGRAFRQDKFAIHRGADDGRVRPVRNRY